MKEKIAYCIYVSLLWIGIIPVIYAQHQYIPIIPQPNHFELTNGKFTLRDGLSISASDKETEKAIRFLRDELLNKYNIFSRQIENKDNDIRYSIVNKPKKVGLDSEGSYKLTVNEHGVHIQASTDVGLFYGSVSLLQLLDHFYTNKNKVDIPFMTIEDSPKFSWRGFMLDESRHFFGKEKVKQLLDWMAYYKLNKFHWHLTDEPGWRVEVKKYPMLGKIGGIGTFTNPEIAAQYYTQEEIKEIVSYAKDRHIDVIPEIDMPGHATAANRAYPQFSGGGNRQHPDFTFHPGKEGTYQYLTNILKEINLLFPSGVVHLGGDEVSFGNDKWEADTAIKALKVNYGLKNNKDVETYFMRRMADSLYHMGAQIAVWDEMADSGLPADKTIQYWWRHDKVSQLDLALKNGYPVVICPRIPFYFDFVQEENHKVGRKWAGAYASLEQLYKYDFGDLLAKQQRKGQILGAQANLWTETIPTSERFDFMVFPRIAALAESVWTNDNVKDYAAFQEQLKAHLKLYKADNLYFYDPFSNSNPEPRVKVLGRQYLDNPE